MDLIVDEFLEHSSQIRPCQGERLSGDAVVIRPLEQGLFVAIVDVLGHGPEAHELTHVIDAYLDCYGTSDVSGLMTRLHQHLKGSRGAAVGLCAIDATTVKRKPDSFHKTASSARICARPCTRRYNWSRGT